MKRLDFSLVTTCRNEIGSFGRWKENILEQSRQPSEIVIVDAFSEDGTTEKLYEWSYTDSRVKVLLEKGPAAHGRNFAIKNSNFEIILSTDMGLRLSPNWCEELITKFETDPWIDVVAGNTCIDIDTVKTISARSEYYFENGGKTNFGPGFVPGNRSVAYKKNVWIELNELPEDLTFYADDSVFGRQMIQKNLKIAFAPGAMTYWARPQKLKDFFREQYGYGLGDGEALIKTPWVFKKYRERLIPLKLLPIAHATIQLFKTSVYKGVIKALKNGDLPAAFFIPVLIAGKGYNFMKGYLAGYKIGNIKCNNCRSRLYRDSNGYSLV